MSIPLSLKTQYDRQMNMIDRILDLLPQTQCKRCGYDSCRSYARAIAEYGIPINRCPTGGQAGIKKLATLLQCDELPADKTYGEEMPYSVALIDEMKCTGCTLCIQACPTDAIIGTGKMMHTVINDYCTGCELCIPKCPVDCISLKNISGTTPFSEVWDIRHANNARVRFERRQQRFQDETKRLDRLAAHISSGGASPSATVDTRSELVRKALERARKKATTFNRQS